jgi:hypothetical protein
MRRTNAVWSNEDLERLKVLVASGATVFRASVALKRSRQSVQAKARSVGAPFPSQVVEKARRKAILYPERARPVERGMIKPNGDR